MAGTCFGPWDYCDREYQAGTSEVGMVSKDKELAAISQ